MIPVDVAWDQEVQWEKCVDHDYKDDRGNHTTGCGNLLTFPVMMALAWLRRADDQPATKDEIAAEWQSVDRLPAAMSEAYYAKFTKLYLPLDKIKALFGHRVAEFTTTLARMFPGYDDMPQAAQLALFDMIFNLGEGTLAKFTTFCDAIKARKWEIAAMNCHRKNRNSEIAPWDPTDQHERRQIMVRDLLLSCANNTS